MIQPSIADPTVKNFDIPNVVVAPLLQSNQPLVVFLPGTGGRPTNVLPLLNVVAGQGYRVIGLSYDDQPSVSQVCPSDPNPDCSALFRNMRSWGEGKGPVTNPKAESIVIRLAKLLVWLDHIHPSQNWRFYLHGGQPAWNHIILSGFSQGAGMAAFIAKRELLSRVVLFSSPWDELEPSTRPAPWLYSVGATPPQRWWAERHIHERMTDVIARAYTALGIPDNHILLFKGLLKPGVYHSKNPFHVSTVKEQDYAPQWRTLYGKITDQAGK